MSSEKEWEEYFAEKYRLRQEEMFLGCDEPQSASKSAEEIAKGIIKDSQPNLTNEDIPEDCIVYLHKYITQAILDAEKRGENRVLARIPSEIDLENKIKEWNLPDCKSEWIDRRNDENMPMTLLSYEVTGYIEDTYDWLTRKLKGE